MSDALIAIGSGLVLAAFIIVPMAAETSGGRRQDASDMFHLEAGRGE